MSIPLTLKPRLFADKEGGICSSCKHQATPLLSIHLSKDTTDPLCLSCAETGEVEGFLVLAEPEPIKTGPRPPSRAVKLRSKKRELRIAEDLGGRRQKASGALPWAKGDVRVRGRWRIDDKMTESLGFTVTRGLLTKVRSECGQGEKMAIVIGFHNKLNKKQEDQVVVIDYETFKELVNAHVD